MVTQFDPYLNAAEKPGASARPAHAGAVYPETPAAARTLWQIFESTVEVFLEAIAVDDGQSAASYRELLEQVRQAAGRLAAAGIGGGSAELYLSILAVLSVGAAYVPVDMDDPDERAELIWSTADVRAILGDGGALTWRGRGRPGPVGAVRCRRTTRGSSSRPAHRERRRAWR
jgi:non-ribosomal peptide synthetase component F